MSEQDRFWSHVQKGPGCWTWTAALDHHGYGRFWVGRRNVGAHRFALALETGDRPGMCALHSCDNPPCVNPAHLRWGTLKDNQRDVVERGRRSGTHAEAWATKLTRADAEEIRRLLAEGESKERLGRMFGVSARMVAKIERGQSWA